VSQVGVIDSADDGTTPALVSRAVGANRSHPIEALIRAASATIDNLSRIIRGSKRLDTAPCDELTHDDVALNLVGALADYHQRGVAEVAFHV
jgi:hypothetical protein